MAEEVAMAITRPGSVFPWRRYVVVPNVSWGLVHWEADLIALAPSGYMYEVEIKVSHSDLKADFDKPKHRRGMDDHAWRKLRGFYYAMPAALYALAIEKHTPIPEYAGIITVAPRDSHPRPRLSCRVERHPTLNRHAAKLGAHDMYQLARLGVMRYWTRREARQPEAASAPEARGEVEAAKETTTQAAYQATEGTTET